MKRLALFLPVLLLACSSEPANPDLKLAGGWARESVPGQTSGAAYLTIINNGTGEDRLVGVSAEVADHSMVHSTTTTDEGVSQMRHMDHGLEIPAKTAVELSPGQTHIMLMGLKEPLRRGQLLTLEFDFEKSGRKQTPIKVLDPASAGLQEAR